MFVKSVTQPRTKQHQFNRTGSLLPILSPTKLLHNVSYEHYVPVCRNLIGLSAEYFDGYYQKLIDNFAAIVQMIPLKPGRALYTLLQDGLIAGLNAVHNFHQEYPKANKIQNAQLIYAIFSAALLKNIANLTLYFYCNITDEKGLFIKHWLAYQGSMVNEGEYFKLLDKTYIYPGTQAASTIILAKLVMPEEGFAWLASDARLLEEWFNALLHEDETVGRVGRSLRNTRRDELFVDGNLAYLDALPLDLLEAIASMYGEAFLHWLRNGIKDGSIKVNHPNAHIHRVAEGVFIERGYLAKNFADLYNAPVSFNIVEEQLGNLFGIVKKSGDDYVYEQYFSEPHENKRGENVSGFLHGATKNHQRREGVIIPHPELIFDATTMPVMSQHLHSTRHAEGSLPSLLPKESPQFKQH